MAKQTDSVSLDENTPSQEKKKVVLLGLGYVHLLALKRFADQKQNPPFELTLITEHINVPLKTMIPDFIAGFCKRESIHVTAEQLLEKLKIEVIRETAIDIDTKKQNVKLKSGKTVSYDYLSINCGARPDLQAIKGAASFGHFNKPIRGYQQAIMDFCDSLRGRRKVTIVQVGSADGGLENILALMRRMKAYGTEANVHLIEPANRLMPNHPKKVSTEMLKVAEANKINVHLEKEVVEAQAGSVILSDGMQIPSDFTSISAPLVAATWLRQTPLKLHDDLIRVNHHLQTTEGNVFATGLVAVDPERNWPRSHRAAAKQAKVLFQNLRASALGLNLKKYRASAKETHFISDGNGKAMFARGNIVFSRRPFFWNWKVKRDHKFQNIFAGKKEKPQNNLATTEPA